MSAVHEDHLLTPEALGDERAVEAALRPRSLEEVVGQHRVRDQLGLVLEAARLRERAPDHVLLSEDALFRGARSLLDEPTDLSRP